jgi:predicted porin
MALLTLALTSLLFRRKTTQLTAVTGSYDLGSVKLGAGFGRYNYTNNEKSKSEAAFGVSAPLGPVTVGAYFATAKKADAKASGVSFGAKYDLSKRTNVVGKFGSWKNSDKDTAGATTTVKSNRLDLLVSHSF